MFCVCVCVCEYGPKSILTRRQILKSSREEENMLSGGSVEPILFQNEQMCWLVCPGRAMEKSWFTSVRYVHDGRLLHPGPEQCR